MPADCTCESAFVTQVSLAGGAFHAVGAIQEGDLFGKEEPRLPLDGLELNGCNGNGVVRLLNQRAFDSTCDQAAKTSTGDAS